MKKHGYSKPSILFLGIIMVADGFGVHVPSWFSPVITFAVLGYFFYRSKKELEGEKQDVGALGIPQ